MYKFDCKAENLRVSNLVSCDLVIVVELLLSHRPYQ